MILSIHFCSKTARCRPFLAVVRCCVTTTLAAETFGLLNVYLNYKFRLDLPSFYLFFNLFKWDVSVRSFTWHVWHHLYFFALTTQVAISSRSGWGFSTTRGIYPGSSSKMWGNEGEISSYATESYQSKRSGHEKENSAANAYPKLFVLQIEVPKECWHDCHQR